MDGHQTNAAAGPSGAFDINALLRPGPRAPTAEFKDATAELRSACAALEHGQMVAVPQFTLMDSMAAIKIMDVRMDSGMLLPPSELPEAERLSATSTDLEFDPLRPLDTNDVIWIMDRLLACEAAWYQGSALSQSLFTCLYVHSIQAMSPRNPVSLQPGNGQAETELLVKVLRAYILATMKTMALIWLEVSCKQNIVDGEDFSSDKNGLDLLDSTDTGHVISQVEDALQWLQSNEQVKDSPAGQSLKARLGFRKQFLYAVSLLQTLSDVPPFDVVMHCKFARRHLASMKPSSLEAASTQAPSIQGLQQPDRSLAPSSAAMSAFDPAYNRKLVSSAPLRAISLPRAETTWRLMDGVLYELQEVVHVLQHPGFESWKTFFTYRSMQYQRAQPVTCTPYIRSLFQTAICDRNLIASRLPLEWLAEAFLQEVALVDPLLLRRASRIGRDVVEGGAQVRWNAPPSVGQQLNFFLQRLAGNLVSYLTLLSQNRARTKRRLGSPLYREWVMLSEEASALGQLLEKEPEVAQDFLPDSLYAATQHLTLEIMSQVIYSGFELDLYANGMDREAMWWLGSRIQQEQRFVCTDLERELKRKSQGRTDIPHKRSASTVAYLTQQIHVARALENLSVSTLYLLHLFPSSVGPRGWPLDSKEPQKSRLELAKAVFATRVKWMRIPSRSSAFDPQVESLWSEYTEFAYRVRDQSRDELVSATIKCLTQAQTDLGSVLDSFDAQRRQDPIHKDALQFAQSLLTTAQSNLAFLQRHAQTQNTASSPVWKFDNQWIPTLA